MKENYNVNVPVMLRVFIRPNSLKEVFSVIRKAKPRILFLVSDGPRRNIPGDKEKINLSREVVSNIDWDCDVHRLYYDENLGMYESGIRARKYIFNRVDRCIFLEDDLVPSISFFRFCEELLERYKDDKRIHRICGTNSLVTYEGPTTDYFFSKEGSIWGFATWKRVYEKFDYSHDYSNDSYVMKLLKKSTPKEWFNRYVDYGNNILADNHIAGPEFFFHAAADLENSLNIVPTKNMIKNIGVVEGSIHSADSLNKLPRGVQKLFNSMTFEIEFPLNHPKYVIEDKIYYEKVNRIFGIGYPRVILFRKIESLIRYLLSGDFSGAYRKISNRLFSKNIEK